MPGTLATRPRFLTRRRLLRMTGLAVVGGAGLALAGCGENQAAGGGTGSGNATSEARHFALVEGWYRDQEARYYDFGRNTPTTGDKVETASIWAFITGMDSEGEPQFVEGQGAVVDVEPGDDDYSDLWEVTLVTVPDGYEPGSIRSAQAVADSGFEMFEPEMLVNCPLVPAGSTLEEGPELQQGWRDGREVFYPNFGPNPASANPLLALITGFDDDGNPRFVEGQGSIIDAVPRQEDYSAFWRVNLVLAPAGYKANELRSAEAVLATGWEITETDIVVNCPVVSPVE